MAAPPPTSAHAQLPHVDLKPLLSRLWPLGHPKPVTADEIAEAISYFFTNQVSEVQASSLLITLHFTGLDRQADVLAKTAAAMLKAAAKIDASELQSVVEKKGRREGDYHGGLVLSPLTPLIGSSKLTTKPSATLLAQEAILITPSISAPPPRSLPRVSSSLPNMAIKLRPPSPAPLTSSPACPLGPLKSRVSAQTPLSLYTTKPITPSSLPLSSIQV